MLKTNRNNFVQNAPVKKYTLLTTNIQLKCSCFTAPIRFEGGKTKYEGRVEIFHSGLWGTLCGSGFDESDARVVCRMLGKDLL